jgi:serine/threonine protein kinase/CheY-like chemotaxis protein
MSARILIVDDTRENRTHLARRLVRDGYEVLTAESGSGGLDVLELNEVQAVLLDVMMPDMTGHQVLAEIRKNFTAAQLPVIMLSANTDTTLKVEALALGANDYLGKPVEYEFLVAKLQQLIPKSPPQVHELVPGCMLGQFKLDRLIGQGGMGKVFVATDQKLLREAALKVVLPSSDPASRQRFLREGRAVAQISHPNVVTIYEIQEEPLPYIAMEMVHGSTLDGLPKLEDRRIFDILKGICQALQATHERGILHRDLKPSNVMLSKSGGVKVMDFGLAKFSNSNDGLTGSGEIMGTPYYMSPEHFQSAFGVVDEASDIFAVGSILYELLTGSPAFEGPSVTNVMFAIISKDVELPDTCNPVLAKICQKALEKDKAHRYKSAQEILDDLAQLAP